MTAFYEPYPYNPALAFYFMGKPLPQDIQQAALEVPQAATHLTSVWQFSTWLRQYFPAMADIIMNSRPDLLDAGAVVSSGAIAPSAAKPAAGGKLAGLGDVFDVNAEVTPAWPDSTVTATPSSTASSAGILSEWGKTVSDLLGKYMAYDQQKKLIDLNIKRAEQGLPPVDSSQYGVGVNVGVSPQVTKFAYIALGGLVIVGLMSAFGKAR